MTEALKRTVQLGSMAYVDPSGQVRRADCGAEVEVHPDHVERFDRLNVLQVASERADTPQQVSAAAEVPMEAPRRRRPRRASED